MTFLNPLVLLGLAAAAIPVLLHLLNLRRLKTIEFSSLKFLRELQKTKIRKLQLKQILLLILRTLIVVFAVLAFARPTLETSLPGFGSHARTSAVLIIDNSFSMDVADERGVRLKQAKDAAVAMLASLEEGDEVALVHMANLNDQRFFEFTRNFSLLRQEIQKLPVSYTVGRMESSLRLASSILATSQNINKEVFVITDGQRNILEEDISDSLRIFDNSVAIYVVPIGLDSKAGERNLSVDSLNVITRIFETEKPVEVEARIRNSGSDDVNGIIVSMLFDDQRVAQRAIDIPAGETRMVAITATPRSTGSVRARVQVEGDVLDADNERFFGFVIPEIPRVAIVGAPADTRFLTLALVPNPREQQKAEVTPLTTAQLATVNLAEFDVIYLSNMPAFGEGEVLRLLNYVNAGGSLFIMAGGESQFDNYNRGILAAFDLGTAVIRDYPEDSPVAFSSVDRVHPLFTGVFKGSTERSAVESPRIYRAAPLSRSPQAIISIPDGALLAESKSGNGKVFYCGLPASGEWSTFPFTGIFVTIANRALTYLAARESLGEDVIVGEAVNVKLPKKYAAGGNFKIADPDNTEFYRQAAVLPGGAVLSLEALHQPGVYIVKTSEDRVVKTLAVNPPASESLIVPLPIEDLLQAIRVKVPDDNQVTALGGSLSLADQFSRTRVGTELWKLFIMLAILCAVAEMLIARNRRSDLNPVEATA